MRLRTGLALALAAATACSSSACSSPTSPSSSAFELLQLAVGAETAAFEYRHAPDDSVDVEWQETYHRWAIGALDLPAPRRIRYNKYRSREHMGSLIGNGSTNGFADAERFEIHTIWPRDNHEVVHLYSSAFGRPVALWTEGLAVAFQTDPASGDLRPRWSRVPVDDHARAFRAQGRLIPIAELLTTASFRRFDDNVTYPQAGSFVRFVLDTCGLGGVKRLFASGSSSDAADGVRAQFEAACSQTLQDTEAAWLRRLEGATP
jgi:hypothetical protein